MEASLIDGGAAAEDRSQRANADLPPLPESQEAALQMDRFAKSTLETTQTPSGRSAFLAGFCYYEMGRHAFYGDASGASVYYVRALLGTFVFSVISVSVASLFARYLTTLTFPAAQRGYVAAASNWSRAVLRSNAIAYLCFAVAQMYLGYTYYPTTCGSALSSCVAARKYANASATDCTDEAALARAGCHATLYRQVPFIGGITMAVGFITAWGLVLYRFSRTGGAIIDKYGRAHTGQLPGGMEVRVSMANPSASAPLELITSPMRNDGPPSDVADAQQVAGDGGTDQTEVAQQLDANIESHPRAEFLLSVGRTVANQALFVASFSLAAQTRLLTSSEDVTRTGTLWYIVFMTVATTSCMICAAGLTNFDVLMTDMLYSGLTDKSSCDLFADKMDRLVFAFFSLFALGCVSFLAGLGLLGWGVGISDGSRNDSYEHFAWIPAVATTSSGAVLLFIVVVVVVSANRIRRRHPRRGVGKDPRSPAYEKFMAEISMVGEQVTLCCGYVSRALPLHTHTHTWR
jgi:hypothetical protein